MTKLEEIARLICKARGVDPDTRADEKYRGVNPRPDIELGDMLEWQCAIGWAKSIVKTLREPTEAMASVGAPMMKWRALGGGPLDPLAHAAEVYRAMVAEILAEQP